MRRSAWVLLCVGALWGCSDESSESSATPSTDESMAAAPETMEPAPEPSAESEPEPEPEAPPPDASWVDLLHEVRSMVAVSSVFRDRVAQVERLWDGDLETAWNSERMAEGATNAQTLTIRLPEGVKVHAIELTAGYTKMHGDADLFLQNRRISRVRIRREGAEPVEADLDIEDRELQRVAVEGGGGDWTIDLLAWEDGSRPDFRELVVSELRVLGELDADDVPTASHPRGWVGRLPPEDLQSVADSLLAQIFETDEFEGDDFDWSHVRLTNPGRMHVGRFSEGGATIPIRMAPRRCYAIVGTVDRPEITDDNIGPGIVDFEGHDNELFDNYGDDTAPGELLIGIAEPICPTEPLAGELTIDDDAGAWYAVQVFEQVGIDAEGLPLPPPGEPGAPSIAAPAEGMRITELALAPRMEGHDTVDPRGTYSKANDERVYCFFRLENPDRDETSVSLAWEDAGGNTQRDPTIVDVPGNRTFAHFRYTTTSWRRPGDYSCVIRSEDEEELGRIAFTLGE